MSAVSVTLSFERLGRGSGPFTEVVYLPDVMDAAFLDALAEAVFDVARGRLVSSSFEVTTRFDDDSTHSGRFSVEADRFGRGTWELTP